METDRRGPSPLRAELAATLTLALPLVVTNLAQIGLTTVDVILIGRLGPDAVAAAALGTNLFFACMFVGIGLTAATAPMMAAAIGGRRRVLRDVRRTFRQGLWTALIVCLPIWALLWRGEEVLAALGQEPRLAAEAGPFLRTLQWGLLPLLAAGVLRYFLAAVERPAWGLAISLVALPVNGLLAWGLIHGRLGLPQLGLVGAGIATTVTSTIAFMALVLVLVADRRFRRWRLFGRLWRPDWPRLARLWALGVPIAATILFETGLFNAAALVVGTFGATPLAAHAVALQIASTTFMAPLGIAQAASVRVGLAYGAGDPEGVGRAGNVALSLAAIFMGTTALVMLIAPETLVGLFLDRREPANAPAVALAVQFLFLAALFQLADGVQAVAAGCLRGLQDTRIPMIYAGLGYWGAGATLGVALALPGGLAGQGVWIGLATGLGIVAVLLTWRWSRRDSLAFRRP